MAYCRWFLKAETCTSELHQIIIVLSLFSLLIVIIVMIML